MRVERTRRNDGWQRTMIACVVGAVGVVAAGPAGATVYTVSSSTPPNTVDAKCGLIEAIRASVTRASVDSGACPAGTGVDTIQLGSGTYTLVSYQGMEIWSDQITFQGAGMGSTVIVSPNTADLLGFFTQAAITLPRILKSNRDATWRGVDRLEGAASG